MIANMIESILNFINSELIKRQEDDEDLNLNHAIRFFEVSHLLHELMIIIANKSLDPEWEKYLDAFKQAAKEYLRPCQHIGMSNIQFNMKFNHHFRNFVSSFNGAYEEVH